MNRKKKKNSETLDTLLELICGILAAGIVIQLIELGITAAYTQLLYTRGMFAVGFWIGAGTAAALSVHMYRSIDKALSMYTEDAEKYMKKAYLFRTAGIFAVAAAVTYLDIGYVMAYFLGVLCLKFGAFLQPLMHNIRKRFRK